MRAKIPTHLRYFDIAQYRFFLDPSIRLRIGFRFLDYRKRNPPSQPHVRLSSSHPIGNGLLSEMFDMRDVCPFHPCLALALTSCHPYLVSRCYFLSPLYRSLIKPLSSNSLINRISTKSSGFA